MSIKDITTGQTFATVSDAINGSNDGDVIRISAGTYREDFPKIRHSLTLQGTGGLAHLVPAGSPSNGQGILVIDAPYVHLDHLELSGAAVPDGNGAGVRFETGTELRISNSWLHDNQDGLLANGVAGASIRINRSEFDHNGAGDGYTHNIYAGAIGLLQVKNSSIHDALGGHEIKSRALRTIVAGNHIADGPTAQTSYSIDLPNGGNATITGNTIEKGPNTPNSSVIHFGGESFPVYGNSAIAISANTVVNDRAGVNFLLNQTQNAAGARVMGMVSNNIFYGMTAAQLGNDLVSVNNLFPAGLPAAVPIPSASDVTLAGALSVDPLVVDPTVLTDIRGAEFTR